MKNMSTINKRTVGLSSVTDARKWSSSRDACDRTLLHCAYVRTHLPLIPSTLSSKRDSSSKGVNEFITRIVTSSVTLIPTVLAFRGPWTALVVFVLWYNINIIMYCCSSVPRTTAVKRLLPSRLVAAAQRCLRPRPTTNHRKGWVVTTLRASLTFVECRNSCELHSSERAGPVSALYSYLCPDRNASTHSGTSSTVVCVYSSS